MKTTSKLCVLALSANMLFFSSCQEDDSISEIDNQNSEISSVNTYAVDRVTQDLDDFAFILSESLDDKVIKKAIKEEALKMYDGDYNILYKNLRTKELSNGDNFNQRIAKSGKNARLKNARISGKSVEDIADSIAALYPNLQVSVPVHIENWNPEDQPVLVAICPNAPESEVKMIKAYDEKGDVHWLDSQIDPTAPVIVVGLSERTDQNGNLLKNFEKTLKSESTNARTRNEGYPEKIFQAYCSGKMNIYEGWTHGAPELRLVISTGKVPNIVDEIYSVGSRYDINNSWWTADGRLLFNWYRADYSDVAVFQWFEWDGNQGTAKLTGSVSYKDEASGVTTSTGYEITYHYGDFDFGKKVVNFKDNSGQEYNIGYLKWKGYN